MTTLSQASCEACRIGAPTVSDSEATELLQQIPEWTLIEIDGIKQLQRQYKFKNLKKKLHFHSDHQSKVPPNNLLSPDSSCLIPVWNCPESY